MKRSVTPSSHRSTGNCAAAEPPPPPPAPPPPRAPAPAAPAIPAPAVPAPRAAAPGAGLSAPRPRRGGSGRPTLNGGIRCRPPPSPVGEGDQYPHTQRSISNN